MNFPLNGGRTAAGMRSKRGQRVRLYFELLMLDILFISASFWACSKLFTSSSYVFDGWRLIMMIVPLYLGFALSNEVYSKAFLDNPKQNVAKACTSLFYAFAAVILVTYGAHNSDRISRITFGMAAMCSIVALILIRYAYARTVLHRMSGAIQNEIVIIDDVDQEMAGSENFLRLSDFGLRPDLGDPRMIQNICILISGTDRVIVACSVERRETWTLLLRGANVQGEFLLPEQQGHGVLGVGRFGKHVTQVVSRGPLSTSNRARKRALDLMITVPAIIILSPFLALAAIAIKLDSPGPIFFRQDRVGRGNQYFKILKFRSMRDDQSDAEGNQSTARDDDRITKVGRFFRRTSIDELPQFFNVLIGDMSLVGPRPHALGSLAGDQLFWDIDRRYWLRHALKPGITGLAQVRGFRGATLRRVDLEDRLAADLEYIQNWSLLNEIKILLGTAFVLVHRNAF